jgi:hypothetical protein
MNMRFAFLLLAILVLAPSALAQSADEKIKSADEVRKLERAWLDAYEQHDVKGNGEYRC